MTDYTKLGTEIGDLVTQKNAAYGGSFAKAGEFLRLLWPGGVPAGREDDALLLVRIFDKQMRIATDRDAFGESPYRDIAGYGLLGAALHEEREAPCGSASADAEEGPKARHGSQPPSVPAPTTTNAAEPRPRTSSGGCFPTPVFSSRNEALQDAFAPTATASAASEEEDRRSDFSEADIQWAMQDIANTQSVKCCGFCRTLIEGQCARRVVRSPNKRVTLFGVSIHDHCVGPFHLWATDLGLEEFQS